MRIGSLFSGAGGLDMAVEAVFGGEVVWHSEVDKAAAKVLAYRWPEVPNLGDITGIDWATVPAVDVMCGGYPCQPFSHAGQRKGHADERHLWPYFAEAIRRIRPRYAVLENVAGHRSMGFDSVLADLAESGYDAQWVCLRASDVGAPHRRERIFIVAADAGYRDESERSWQAGRQAGERFSVRAFAGRDRDGIAADAHVDDSARRLDPGEVRRVESESSRGGPGIDRPAGRFARDSGETDSGAVNLLPTPVTTDAFGARNSTCWRANQATTNINPADTLTDVLWKIAADRGEMALPTGPARAVNELLSTPQARDSKGVPKDGYNTACLARDIVECDIRWGKYEPAVTRWENFTRPSPKPTEPGVTGLKRPRLSAPFSEWLMGWPQGWVTDPNIGISRNDQLRIIGNGVCPQQAIAALTWLLQIAETAA